MTQVAEAAQLTLQTFQACDSTKDINKNEKIQGGSKHEAEEGFEEEENKPERYFDEKKRQFICPECSGGFEFRDELYKNRSSWKTQFSWRKGLREVVFS